MKFTMTPPASFSHLIHLKHKVVANFVHKTNSTVFSGVSKGTFLYCFVALEIKSG